MILFSSQQGELNQVLKVDSKAVCDIDEFESDSENGEECADDKVDLLVVAFVYFIYLSIVIEAVVEVWENSK